MEQDIKRCLIIGRKSATNAIASSFLPLKILSTNAKQHAQDKLRYYIVTLKSMPIKTDKQTFEIFSN